MSRGNGLLVSAFFDPTGSPVGPDGDNVLNDPRDPFASRSTNMWARGRMPAKVARYEASAGNGLGVPDAPTIAFCRAVNDPGAGHDALGHPEFDNRRIDRCVASGTSLARNTQDMRGEWRWVNAEQQPVPVEPPSDDGGGWGARDYRAVAQWGVPDGRADTEHFLNPRHMLNPFDLRLLQHMYYVDRMFEPHV